MNTIAKFELEQDIINCWHVTDDIQMLFENICDDSFFTGMDPAHADKISNILLGMRELYNMRFERCFANFEKLLNEEK